VSRFGDSGVSRATKGHAAFMTTALDVLLVLVAWTLLALPLAVLVGRFIGTRPEGTAEGTAEGAAAEPVAVLDQTFA